MGMSSELSGGIQRSKAPLVEKMTSSRRGPDKSELKGTVKERVTGVLDGGAGEVDGAVVVRLNGCGGWMSVLFVLWPPKGIEGALVMRSHPLLAVFAM